MSSNLGPIAAALISWIVFNTIGKPLLRFFDLRTEVRRTMILYDNVRARWRERDNVRVLATGDEDMTPDNFERLQEAEMFRSGRLPFVPDWRLILFLIPCERDRRFCLPKLTGHHHRHAARPNGQAWLSDEITVRVFIIVRLAFQHGRLCAAC